MSIFPTDVPRCRAQFTSPLVIDPGAYSSFYAFYVPIGDGVALRSAPHPVSSEPPRRANLPRLRSLLRALTDARDAGAFFNMNFYGYDDGRPACALGHYAARRDLQQEFTLKDSPHDPRRRSYVHNAEGEALVHFSAEILDHFGITCAEAEELFSSSGCGRAGIYINRAIKYVESFIAAHTPPERPAIPSTGLPASVTDIFAVESVADEVAA